MKVPFRLVLLSGLAGILSTGVCAAASSHLWIVSSPTHEQTYAYGEERHQQWTTRGNHLALSTEFTNDPYVDRIETRQYDDFVFDFPNIKLGSDGRTFYYRAPNGRSVPVAIRHPGFLGFNEITLLNNSALVIRKPHGYLSLELLVASRPLGAESDG